MKRFLGPLGGVTVSKRVGKAKGIKVNMKSCLRQDILYFVLNIIEEDGHVDKQIIHFDTQE